jgi:hypothetical protein
VVETRYIEPEMKAQKACTALRKTGKFQYSFPGAGEKKDVGSG